MIALDYETVNRQFVSFEQLVRREGNLVSLYGVERLERLTELITQRFGELGADASRYSVLSSRMAQGHLGMSELAHFMNVTPMSLTVLLRAAEEGVDALNSIAFFAKLEAYLDREFITTVTSGAARDFQGVLVDAKQFLSMAAQRISDLRNFIGKITADPVEAIKNIAMQVVERLAGDALARIRGALQTAMSFYNRSVATFNHVQERVRQVQEFFSPENIQSIRDRVEATMTEITGTFEELTLENVDYAVFRASQIIDFVSRLLQSPSDAISSLLSRVDVSTQSLTNMSVMARGRNVELGALRVDPEYAAALRAQVERNVNSNAAVGTYAYSRPASPVPLYSGSSGSSASDVASASASRWVTEGFTEEEMRLAAEIISGDGSGNQYIMFAPSVLNMSPPSGGAGWKRVQPDVYMRIFRVARRLGTRFQINSAYRSPQYNANLPGAARNSLHMSGQALDVDMTRLGNSASARNEFIKIASQEGYGGIGTYSSFIHVDTGPRRKWGSLNSSALNVHVRDGYRSG